MHVYIILNEHTRKIISKEYEYDARMNIDHI
jgi:hypothetical protein